MLVVGSSPPRWREVFRGSHGRLLVGLLVLEVLFAMHFLTVATVMPAVLADLGNVSLYGASFWAASLAQLAAIPIASAFVDRYGARRPLIWVAVIYVAGLLIAAAAPGMALVVLGRTFQGVASGGGYALSIAVVAKQVPEEYRARIMALMASTWILPGLLGPPIGALLISTVGWRWAFIAPLPVLIASLVMILPRLRDVGASTKTTVPVRPTAQLAIGGFALFAALTYPSPTSLLLGAGGAVAAAYGLRGLVPRGTFRAKPGPPAAAAAAFLASMAFIAADSFVPLMLTEVRGLSIAAVGVGFTLQTIAWPLGSWWQSGLVERHTTGAVVVLGTILMAAGFGITATGLSTSVPIEPAYVGWVAAAFGMGLVFPTIPLAAMAVAGAGREGTDLSPTLLMDMTGIAVGQGLGGVALSNAVASGLGLTVGLGGAFLTTGIAAAALLAVAPRIPDIVRKGRSPSTGMATGQT